MTIGHPLQEVGDQFGKFLGLDIADRVRNIDGRGPGRDGLLEDLNKNPNPGREASSAENSTLDVLLAAYFTAASAISRT